MQRLAFDLKQELSPAPEEKSTFRQRGSQFAKVGSRQKLRPTFAGGPFFPIKDNSPTLDNIRNFFLEVTRRNAQFLATTFEKRPDRQSWFLFE
jgi:hypothetical protein